MTTDRATLLALAHRVEAASGPDRELDCAIALAAGFQLKTVDGTRYWRRGDFSWTAESWDCPSCFTGSIDAALPNEGSGYWEISGPRRYLNIPTPVPDYWRASFCWHDRLASHVVGWGATEPLARRAAALRALAQEAPSNER